MKMSFEDLKKQITDYIVKPHHHSTWNLKYLHFIVKHDKSARHNKHYYVCYGDKSRRFKIAMCNNNIKLQNVSNIPGSFHDNKGRILGACLDFVRHNGSQTHNNHNYLKDWKANKWEQYDIQQFDKNDMQSKSTQQSSTPRVSDGSDLNFTAKDIIKFNIHAKDIKNKMPITFSSVKATAKKLGFVLDSYSALNGIANSGNFENCNHPTYVSFNIDKVDISVSGVNQATREKVSKLSSAIQNYCISANLILGTLSYDCYLYRTK